MWKPTHPSKEDVYCVVTMLNTSDIKSFAIVEYVKAMTKCPEHQSFLSDKAQVMALMIVSIEDEGGQLNRTEL